VLDFSKIEAGKMSIERIAFPLEDTVCDTLKSLAIRAQSKGIELTCFVDPTAPTTIIGDPVRLRQVLTNLVSNAITYTVRGEVFVRVACPAPGSQLHIAVLDSGIGIKPGELARLFEAFQQGDSSFTRRYGGTGLGLAICKRLVDLMGGEIRAESEPGVGSTFSIMIPCEVAEQPGDRLAREVASAQALAGERVLIVDDNATNRTMLIMLARAAQMRPEAAASAVEALSLLRAARGRGDPIRVAVVDVHMPDVDGFALAERIRKNPEFGDVPIVFLTSAIGDSDVQRCEAFPGTARLMKPVKRSELIAAMLRAFEPSQPVAIAADAAGSAIIDREPRPAGPPAKMRILLAEDSPANRKLTLAILEREGHSAVVAVNGRRAVELCAGRDFDLVLMDVQMPEMDGLEATAEIRAAERMTGRRVPIVAMTAHALHGDREVCLRAGMDDYVSKPIRRRDLLRVLQRAEPQPGLRAR
jgi:CheY-like chemotaxis protein/anti-sigma regulatory factor (Ser/Thr protein kinase)